MENSEVGACLQAISPVRPTIACKQAPTSENPRFARRRGGILAKLLLLLFVLFAFAALGWMLFLPMLVTNQLRSRTGFAVSVSSVSANPFTGRVAVRGLLVNNPDSFPTREFVSLRTFEAAADVWTLNSETLVIDTLKLDVEKIALVRRVGGESNAELFQKGLAGASQAPGPASAAKPAPKRKFLIHQLSLRCDEIVTADYTGAKPSLHEYRLNLDQTFTNISDPTQLLVPGVLRNLTAASVDAGFGGLIPGDFGKAVTRATHDAAKTGADLLKQAGKKTSETFKGLIEKLEDSRKP